MARPVARSIRSAPRKGCRGLHKMQGKVRGQALDPDLVRDPCGPHGMYWVHLLLPRPLVNP
jgi:hypothetical protein